jgi:hypothetical protein
MTADDRRALLSAVAIAFDVVAFVCIVADLSGVVRSISVLVALLFGTGWSATVWFNLDSVALEIATTISSSIVMLILTSVVQLGLDVWYPTAVSCALIAGASVATSVWAQRHRCAARMDGRRIP